MESARTPPPPTGNVRDRGQMGLNLSHHRPSPPTHPAQLRRMGCVLLDAPCVKDYTADMQSPFRGAHLASFRSPSQVNRFEAVPFGCRERGTPSPL